MKEVKTTSVWFLNATKKKIFAALTSYLGVFTCEIRGRAKEFFERTKKIIEKMSCRL